MGYIGNGIQAVRREAGITQQQLADALGISRSMVSLIENGRTLPDYQMVEKMAKILGCTAGDLYRPAVLDLIRRAS